MNYTPVYYKTMRAIAETERFVSSCGGTRSGKTFANLQALFELALQDEVPTLTSVVSETFPHLKRGAIRDFCDMLGDWYDERAWNKSDSIYTLPNGSQIEFFSADSPSKVHGPARDRLFLNEVQNIPYETARQLFVRTRGLILLDYNPTHSFWVNEVIEPRDNCITVHSTYLDNSFLSAVQVREIEDNRSDATWWRVYGEGKVGTLEGLIFDFEQVDALPDPEQDHNLTACQGLDFGFTNDPTARVKIVADRRKRIVWVRERCYATHMKNSHIIEDLQADGVTRREEIFADCAEPKSIAEISDAGFNVIPCDKDAPVKSDKLTFQLQWLQGWKLYVTRDSLNLIKELRNYTWAKDKDGKPQNYPIDKWNHLVDATRYACWTKFGQRAGEGEYHITFSRPRHRH